MKNSQSGSAVVEFILVSVPLLMLSLAVLSVGITNFTMAVLRDSAIEGARYAALADQSSEAGCRRALELSRQAIGKFATLQAGCDSSVAGYESVRLSAQINLLGIITRKSELVAISRSPREM
jgi:Flp pilus assembly protein TadG